MFSRVRQFWRRLLFYLQRDKFDRELEEEMKFHLEMKANENRAAGLSPEEARYASRRQFGNQTLLQEVSRDMWNFRFLETLRQDLRYGVRILLRHKGYTTVAVLTMALGIGANATIFSAVYAVLLKPLPYSQPDQIYSVGIFIPERRDIGTNLPPIQAFLEWRKADTAFSAIATVTPADMNLTGDGEAEHVGGARVSANLFSFLGVPVAHGRSFTPEEEVPGKDRVAIISDALWRRRYGTDPTMIGRSIILNGQSHTVVGIAPASLLVPTGAQLHPAVRFAPRIDVWKPLAPSPDELEGENFNQGVLVRLEPGESVAVGRQQLQAILNSMYRRLVPDMKTELQIQVLPIREIYSGKVRLRLLLVLGASALLLLIACVNIANLFLARVTSRAGEFAIRIALGAGRARVLGQMITESVIIAILAGVIGAIIASFGAGLLSVYGPDEVRILAGSQLSVVILLFSALISLAAGAICGIMPAWQACRYGTATGLQEGSRMALGAGRSRRYQRILVGVEMAMGTALLAAAGLLLHSFIKVMGADRGYVVERVLAANLVPLGQRYSTAQQKTDYYRELTASIRSLPGVLAAGAISELPASAGKSGFSQTIFYDTDTNFLSVVLQRSVAMIRSVTPGYFAASGSVLRAGHFFSEQDQIPVAVISKSLALRLWPGEEPARVVGRTFRQGDVTGPLISIVGIVEDVRPGAADQELWPQIYRPHHQSPRGWMTVVVRTSQEPTALAAALRNEIRKIDANVPITDLRTMRDIVSDSVAERRFQLLLTSLFALVALLLGAVGVYGVVSYSVACRTREIGLRIALGAVRSDVMRWVFSDGMRPVLIGLVIGLGGAVMIAQTLRSLLFEITPVDPLSLGSVGLVLLLTSGLACYLPAHRAARVDPIVALRHD